MRNLPQFLALASVLGVGSTSSSDILTGTSVTTSFGSFNLTTGAAGACKNLSNAYPTQVIFPGSTNYTKQASYYWDIRADLSPACIFMPKTDTQVASAVKQIVQCDAQFAVRGGGHMNFPGSNNIDGGVLLAFNDMTNYKVNKETIEVQPGMKCYDVYSALDPPFGVPGLTLIGGVSYFINKYGFAMDNVASYDIVLGNGTLTTANSTSNQDMFWA